MTLKRYYGTLMYAGFLPFSIDAPDETSALEQMQQRTPKTLTDAEKNELLFHLERIPKADRVQVITEESHDGKKPLN